MDIAGLHEDNEEGAILFRFRSQTTGEQTFKWPMLSFSFTSAGRTGGAEPPPGRRAPAGDLALGGWANEIHQGSPADCAVIRR